MVGGAATGSFRSTSILEGSAEGGIETTVPVDIGQERLAVTVAPHCRSSGTHQPILPRHRPRGALRCPQRGLCRHTHATAGMALLGW